MNKQRVLIVVVLAFIGLMLGGAVPGAKTQSIHSVSAFEGLGFGDSWSNRNESQVKNTKFGWSEETKLIPTDDTAFNKFGYSVAVSGDTIAIGAPRGDSQVVDAGAVYIFQQTANGWVEEAKLTASDGAFQDEFGYSVAISDDTVIVGAYGSDAQGIDAGAAYIFERTQGGWIETTKLIASDSSAFDRFGYSVAINRNIILIGAYGANGQAIDSGAAYIFQRTRSGWSEVTKLIASDGISGQNFGWSVVLREDIAVVGARYDDDLGALSGSAYVFRRTRNGWVEADKLVASDGSFGDEFGFSVAANRNLVIVGARQGDGLVPDTGAAYVFQRSHDDWTETAKLISSDGAFADEFAYSVAIGEGVILIGTPRCSGRTAEAGATYFFQQTPAGWAEVVKIIASDGQDFDYFSSSVALGEDIILIGANSDDSLSGSAYIFQ